MRKIFFLSFFMTLLCLGCTNNPISQKNTVNNDVSGSLSISSNTIVNMYCLGFSGNVNAFVCAAHYGDSCLVANRAAVGEWEQFALFKNSDNTYSFKALVNSKYVTVIDDETPIIASSTSIGTAEKFYLRSESSVTDGYEIKSAYNGRYLFTVGGPILAEMGSYGNTFIISQNKYHGYSASTQSNNTYSWYIYLPDNGSTLHYQIKSSTWSSGATATVYVDGNAKGTISSADGSISYQSSLTDYNLHTFTIQYSTSGCTLDYFKQTYSLNIL
jgi:hypothetical protein